MLSTLRAYGDVLHKPSTRLLQEVSIQGLPAQFSLGKKATSVCAKDVCRIPSKRIDDTASFVMAGCCRLQRKSKIDL
jgi:hypothetical protein